MAEIHSDNSFYKETEIKDFYLDLWDADSINYEPVSTDTEYVIEPIYNNRPDLLANKLYGSPALWWVLAMRNKDLLIDPINDFVTGLTIWVPTRSDVGGI